MKTEQHRVTERYLFNTCKTRTFSSSFNERHLSYFTHGKLSFIKPFWMFETIQIKKRLKKKYHKSSQHVYRTVVVESRSVFFVLVWKNFAEVK